MQMMPEDAYASRWLKMRIREVRSRYRVEAPPPLTRPQINSAADKILAWLDRRGEGTAQDIAHGTGIPRSTVDKVLESLRNRFLVTADAKKCNIAIWRKANGTR